ncbi:MAG: hypothetical protein ACE3JK_18480 [Sporolactobacillus sp.]
MPSLGFAAHTLTRKLNGKYETYQDPTVQSTALRHPLPDWLAAFLPGKMLRAG